MRSGNDTYLWFEGQDSENIKELCYSSKVAVVDSLLRFTTSLVLGSFYISSARYSFCSVEWALKST